MCLDCGCHLPSEDHGDARHILLVQLQGAADASDIPLEEAASNIVETVGALTPEEVFKAAFARKQRRAKRRREG
jgi:hypothetical protein